MTWNSVIYMFTYFWTFISSSELLRNRVVYESVHYETKNISYVLLGKNLLVSWFLIIFGFVVHRLYTDMCTMKPKIFLTFYLEKSFGFVHYKTKRFFLHKTIVLYRI